MTWSKNSKSTSYPYSDRRERTVSLIICKNVPPDRPLVQLKMRTRVESLEQLKNYHQNSKKGSYLGSLGNPTPGVTNHFIQYSKLSVVCAPSRYHTKPGRLGSCIVWQRPGHLVFTKPSLKESDKLCWTNSPLVRSRKKVRANSTAKLAFCT